MQKKTKPARRRNRDRNHFLITNVPTNIIERETPTKFFAKLCLKTNFVDNYQEKMWTIINTNNVDN